MENAHTFIFVAPIIGQYVRIAPLTGAAGSDYMCLKFELIGCLYTGTCNFKIEIPDCIIYSAVLTFLYTDEPTIQAFFIFNRLEIHCQFTVCTKGNANIT